MTDQLVAVEVELNGVPVRLILGAEAIAIIAAAAAPPAPSSSPYMNVREAAEHLRCDRQRIYDLLSARRIERVKDGSRVLIRRDALERYLEDGGTRGRGSAPRPTERSSR